MFRWMSHRYENGVKDDENKENEKWKKSRKNGGKPEICQKSLSLK